MRKLPIGVLGCLALVLALFVTPAGAAYPVGPFGVDVTIERVADGTYLCTAVVAEVTSGEVVAARKVRFRSGQDATVRVGTQDSEGRSAELKFEVSADEAAGTAQFRMIAVQGGVETQLHQMRVRLR